MFKPRKIVCPVDFDGEYGPALKLASEVAEIDHATIYLVHVSRVPNDAQDAPVPIDQHPRWEHEAEQKLEAIARANLAGATYQIVVRSGIADIDIVRIAAELHAELIVMATHGRAGVMHFLMGSLAEKVIREASCPVLIVRGQAEAAAAAQ
jgi:universal stress protein A